MTPNALRRVLTEFYGIDTAGFYPVHFSCGNASDILGSSPITQTKYHVSLEHASWKETRLVHFIFIATRQLREFNSPPSSVFPISFQRRGVARK